MSQTTALFIYHLNDALRKKKKKFQVKHNTTMLTLLKIFKQLGLIEDVLKAKVPFKCQIILKHESINEVIRPNLGEKRGKYFVSTRTAYFPYCYTIRLMSTSRKKIYKSVKELKFLERDRSIYIISTRKGILLLDEAIQKNVGGLVLCKID